MIIPSFLISIPRSYHVNDDTLVFLRKAKSEGCRYSSVRSSKKFNADCVDLIQVSSGSLIQNVLLDVDEGVQIDGIALSGPKLVAYSTQQGEFSCFDLKRCEPFDKITKKIKANHPISCVCMAEDCSDIIFFSCINDAAVSAIYIGGDKMVLFPPIKIDGIVSDAAKCESTYTILQTNDSLACLACRGYQIYDFSSNQIDPLPSLIHWKCICF